MISQVEQILSYDVPVVSGQGNCAGSDCLGSFNAEEYLPFLIDEDKAELLLAMDHIMQEMIEVDQVDWCGVYLKIPAQEHYELFHNSLLKICYRGAVSRGLFPLTESFAKQSNNSTVGLTGEAVTVDDVQDYVTAGGCYYECDRRVRSEYCHPLFDHDGDVIGIVDIESFTPKSFSESKRMEELQEMLERIEALLRAFRADQE